MQSIKTMADAIESGKIHTSFLYKSSGPTGFGARRWADMSMGAGTPKYNAYVGNQTTATALTNQGNDGIYLGPTASTKKLLLEASLMSSTTTLAPSTWFLCDYLLFYPLVDGDSTDVQTMDNTITIPRYDNGQVMLVCTTPTSADASATMTYTNQSGVSGRTTTFTISSTTATGCIMSSHNSNTNSRSPFIPLGNGDSGVRSVESITLSTALGGFFAIVIVRPLTSLVLPENNVVAEMSMLLHKSAMPEIKQGAYLNYIYCPLGAAQNAFPLRGHLSFVWD